MYPNHKFESFSYPKHCSYSSNHTFTFGFGWVNEVGWVRGCWLVVFYNAKGKYTCNLAEAKMTFSWAEPCKNVAFCNCIN